MALHTATNTASLVLGSPDLEESAAGAAAAAAVAEPSSSLLSPATPQTPQPSSSTPVDPAGIPLPQSATPRSTTPTDPHPSASTTAVADLPAPESSSTPPELSPNPSNSGVSSDGETAYDVLLSRSGSGTSNKPLLETPVSVSTDSPASGITSTNGSSTS